MKIGLLGLGTIGSGVFEHISRRKDMEIKRILDLRDFPELSHLLTKNFDDILNDPEIDTVVELIGGIEPAHTFTVKALKAGKNVVSANKLMLSHNMEEILTTAKENNVHYRYDASVGGSIPCLYNIMRHSSADEITGIAGIVNGTTNLILDIMQTSTRGFDDVLKQAQAEGYAEADPSSDIDGIDAECKICIASAVAYKQYVRHEDVNTEGIRYITGEDIVYFKENNYVCRLLAQSKKQPDGVISCYVEPTLVAPESTEAAVHVNNNTVALYGKYFGQQNFQGQGAGKDPTAFAVVMGLVDIMDNVSGKLNPIPEGYAKVDNSAAVHAYYLRTSAEVNIPAKKLGPCGEGVAYITEPMSVSEMHALAKQLREADPRLFFAGIRD
ncbi:MAG: homoserine dehydrogenase [Clostridia bacterium]|nr:homoserine dehydrogenase [Clostridia bacterium]